MQYRLIAFFEELVGTGFFVPDYAIMLALALVMGLYMALRSAEPAGFDLKKVFFSYVFVAGCALAAARIYMVLRSPAYFADRPLEVFYFWQGGLASSGAIIGGLAAAVLVVRLQGLPLAPLLDCCAPSIALTIALGRVGCFLNGCCFGHQSDLFWAMRFPPDSGPHALHLHQGVIGAGQLSLPVHPTQLYEAGYALLVMAILLGLRRKLSGDGRLFAMLFVLYPLGRFANEFLRADDRVFMFGLSFPQWLALLALITAIVFFGTHAPRRARTPVAVVKT